MLEAEPEAFLKGAVGEGEGLADADIDALIAEREAAKLNKDYARADEVREELKEQGIVLEDSREGTRWRRA